MYPCFQQSTPLQASCKSKSFLEGAATVVGPSQKKEEVRGNVLLRSILTTEIASCSTPEKDLSSSHNYLREEKSKKQIA